MKVAIVFGIWCVTLLPLVALNGWALSVLWGWFIAPTFNTAPLALWQAIGISLIAAYLTYQPDLSSDTDASAYWKGLVYSAVKPLISLLFGWLYLAVFA